MVPMEVQWALWSERPEGRTDYTVLSCSDGRLRAAHFNQLITRFSPGSPDSDRAALPRMTIGRVDIEGTPHVGVAIQTHSRHRDGVGRNIAPTSYFCLPYAAPAERRLSYWDLYQELSAIKLPESGGGPLITIDPEPFDPERIAADLAGFGVDPLCAAALLLTKSRRICVTRAEHTTLEERLRFLDCVAALLPYGYRAKLTLSTWTNSATLHRLRLFFARHAREVNEPGYEVTPLPWESGSKPPGGTELAYYDLLAGALDRHERAEVVKALAARAEPRSFSGAEPAVGDLREIDARLDRATRLRDGTYTLDDLRGVIDDRDGDPADLRDHLIKLMAKGDGGDVERIVKELGRLGEADLGEAIPPLKNMASRLLWSSADVRLQGFVEQAARCGYGDRFLCHLIDRPAMSPAGLENGLNAAAHLLAENVMPAPGAYPNTCDALARNIPVALQLIVQLSGTDDEHALTAGLELVRGRLPREVTRPVDVALWGMRKRVEAQEFAALAEREPACVAAVLALASHRDHMNLIIDGFVDWLAAGGGFRGRDQYWNSRLDALDPENAEIRGKLDVLLLMTGGKPSSMTQVVPEQWRAYQAGFAATWRRGWPDEARMIRGLAAHLEAQRWQEGAERADDVRRLMRALLPAEQSAIDKALDRSLLATRHVQAADRPHSAGGGAPPLPTADNALKAIQAYRLSGLPPADACAKLAQEQRIRDVKTALDVVLQIPAALKAQNPPAGAAELWAFVLVRHLCGGTFGDEIAAEFPAAYLNTITGWLKQDIQMLADFTGIETHDQAAQRAIDELRHQLAELADAKKKGAVRRLMPGGKGKHRQGDQDKKSSPKNNFIWHKSEASDQN